MKVVENTTFIVKVIIKNTYYRRRKNDLIIFIFWGLSHTAICYFYSTSKLSFVLGILYWILFFSLIIFLIDKFNIDKEDRIRMVKESCPDYYSGNIFEELSKTTTR